MSTRTILTGAGAATLIAALSLPLVAQTPPPGQPGERGWRGPGARQELMANRLNLTPEQRDQLKKLREQNRAATKDQMVKLSDMRHQLQDQLLSDNPDQAQITALTGQIGQLQQQLFLHRIQQRQQELAIFTPDQRQQLRQWRQDHPGAGFGPMGPWRRFRGPRGGGPGGGF